MKNQRNRWTPEMDDHLTKLIKTKCSTDSAASALERSERATVQRANKLGFGTHYDPTDKKTFFKTKKLKKKKTNKELITKLHDISSTVTEIIKLLKV